MVTGVASGATLSSFRTCLPLPSSMTLGKLSSLGLSFQVCNVKTRALTSRGRIIQYKTLRRRPGTNSWLSLLLSIFSFTEVLARRHGAGQAARCLNCPHLKVADK